MFFNHLVVLVVTITNAEHWRRQFLFLFLPLWGECPMDNLYLDKKPIVVIASERSERGNLP